MTATVTMDFREEYEAERARWLRRRFLWFSGFVAGFHVFLLSVWLLEAIVVGEIPGGVVAGRVITGLVQIGMFAASYQYVRRQPLRRERMLRLVFWLVVASGSLAIVTRPILAPMGSAAGIQGVSDILTGGVLTAFSVHFITSLFIPWTPREAVRPLVPLLVVLAIVTLAIGEGSLLGRFAFILLSPLVGLPGVVICWWRHSRFRLNFHYRMMRRRYGDMQRELVDARRVHESLFPLPIDRGAVRFNYCYQPVRHIGGDYLYTFIEPADSHSRTTPRLSMILLDVTGHGVAAALTVNRIYGELERVFAEEPGIGPGKVLAALNRYVHLTLARQSVYATALCVRVDADGDLLEWANAGHPPPFLRTAAGLVDRLDSTAPLLGVYPRDEYQPGERSQRFGPGDTLIAYTDGAIDAANESGQRLRIDGIQSVLANGAPDPDDRGRWCASIVREIDEYRYGSAMDDTLLVEVYRPIEV